MPRLRRGIFYWIRQQSHKHSTVLNYGNKGGQNRSWEVFEKDCTHGFMEAIGDGARLRYPWSAAGLDNILVHNGSRSERRRRLSSDG
jgi:hypothetical protein